MISKIYIIRHGQTEMNSRKLLQGRTDLPLNSEGIVQAAKTARTSLQQVLSRLIPQEDKYSERTKESDLQVWNSAC